MRPLFIAGNKVTKCQTVRRNAAHWCLVSRGFNSNSGGSEGHILHLIFNSNLLKEHGKIKKRKNVDRLRCSCARDTTQPQGACQGCRDISHGPILLLLERFCRRRVAFISRFHPSSSQATLVLSRGAPNESPIFLHVTSPPAAVANGNGFLFMPRSEHPVKRQ